MTTNKLKLLYIDDEPQNLKLFTYAFKREYNIFCAKCGAEAIDILKENGGIPVIITDQRMPNMTGMEFIEKINPDFPDAIVIILTAYIDGDLLIDAINSEKVYRYIVKPWDKDELRQTLKGAFNQHRLAKENRNLLIELQSKNTHLSKTLNELKKANKEVKHLKNQLELENTYLQEEISAEHNFHEIIGQCDNLKYALNKVQQVAMADSTALILGETGTGKELFARAIHKTSSRRDRPLVKVNCAALPANLIESELFGHEKGAFTGAHSHRIGRFELADEGTIFLDEIGDMPLELQSKLLRVIQEGEFERLGSAKTLKVNVRVIAATNRNLEKAMDSGAFREDLFYRLNVFPIEIPPLRNRKEDVPLLANYFMIKYSKKIGKKIDSIPKKAMESLVQYDWKGNIRELENIIERSVILTNGNAMQLDGSINARLNSGKAGAKLTTLKEMEFALITKALKESNGVVQGKHGAAEKLGIPASTLRDRMKEFGIKKTE